LEPFRAEGRIRYNPKIPKRALRAMPEERWQGLFTAMRSNRDRAILALAISTAARAGELLGIRGADVDWGDQLVRVRRKGSGAEQWLPASAEAFVWLRLYLADVGEVPADGPAWVTLRRRRRAGGKLERQPLDYDALRAVLRRANGAVDGSGSGHQGQSGKRVRPDPPARPEILNVREVRARAQLGDRHGGDLLGPVVDELSLVARRAFNPWPAMSAIQAQQSRQQRAAQPAHRGADRQVHGLPCSWLGWSMV
jgi:hypothetical protein